MTEFIHGFTISPDTQAILHNMAENGYHLSCDVISGPDFWRDDWTACPICGQAVIDGVIIHTGGQ